MSPPSEPHSSGHAYATEETYVYWTTRFTRFCLIKLKQTPKQAIPGGISAYLDFLALERNVAPATQHQALNAMVFLVKNVFGISACRAEDQTSLKLTSQSGAQGWTLATAKHSGGESMNSTLVIITPSKVEMKIGVSRAFIETWGFADSDKAVVVRSRNSHGPSWIEKFDIATGKVVAECQGSNDLENTPKWAQAWCDASKKEAEQDASGNRR